MIVQNITCEQLEKGKKYNVFAICDWWKERKYYISDSDISSYHITPYDHFHFDVIDGNIPKYWVYWKDKQGDMVLWVSEITLIDWFWEKYYDDDVSVQNVINFYHQVGNKELFND